MFSSSAVLLAGLIFVMAALFVSDKVPVDIVALTGLVLITLLGLVSPREAFSGFSSPAVVTMISMFFIGGALRRTGVAATTARWICSRVGSQESVVTGVVMILGATLSAGMNNVAATTVLLPAVIAVSQETNVAPSRLLMPLSFAVILGGMATSIGTTPNILIIDLMRESQIEPFSFLDFFPFGISLVLTVLVFIVVFGRFLLPDRKGRRGRSNRRKDLAKVYRLAERLFTVKVPPRSMLSGLSIGQSRFSNLFGAQIVSIRRSSGKKILPSPDQLLLANDSLLVQGRRSRFEAVLKFKGVKVEPFSKQLWYAKQQLLGGHVSFVTDEFVGKSLRDQKFRDLFNVTVVGIVRDGDLITAGLGSAVIQANDCLQVLGSSASLDTLHALDAFSVRKSSLREMMADRLFCVTLPSDSPLIGGTLKEARLAELLGVQAVGVLRHQNEITEIEPNHVLQGGAILLVVGEPEEVGKLGMLGSLEVQAEESANALDSKDMIITEIVLAPRSKVIGQTLIEANFKERFEFQVLAIWHEGKPYRSNLAQRRLNFGDALLVYGSKSKFHLLEEDSDFVVLHSQEPQRSQALPAIGSVCSLLAVSALGATGTLPLHLAAVIGALIALFSRAIRIEDAYFEVNWKIVFLIAALMPFGTALETSGAADILGASLAAFLGGMGFSVAVVLICLITSFLSQILDSVVSVVLLVPIAISLSAKLQGDVRVMLMAVALSSSIAFVTPFSHKASLLVMGAAGYRVKDYAKLGVPVSILSFAVIWLLLLL